MEPGMYAIDLDRDGDIDILGAAAVLRKILAGGKMMVVKVLQSVQFKQLSRR